jgi:hypothetical protein
MQPVGTLLGRLGSTYWGYVHRPSSIIREVPMIGSSLDETSRLIVHKPQEKIGSSWMTSHNQGYQCLGQVHFWQQHGHGDLSSSPPSPQSLGMWEKRRAEITTKSSAWTHYSSSWLCIPQVLVSQSSAGLVEGWVQAYSKNFSNILCHHWDFSDGRGKCPDGIYHQRHAN